MKRGNKMDYEKSNCPFDDEEDGLEFDDKLLGTFKKGTTTEFDLNVDKPFTSNPCVSVLSKALVQLDKGEITLSEIANLAWILSDIYSDED
jgi:hypothetical protein